MPVLVLPISEYLHKLLQNSRLTPITPLSELCRVMVVTVDLAIVLVVTILGAKYRRAHRAREVVDMVFLVQRRDI